MKKTDLKKYMQLMMGEDGVSFIVKGGGLLTKASGYLNYPTHSCVLAIQRATSSKTPICITSDNDTFLGRA